MTIRENVEKWEEQYLSPYASLSSKSKGREVEEPQCDIRPVYQRDRDRILHSKSFRRMRHKTQVFLSPEGDHYRTRLTHTLEVSQTARTVAKALRLNEDLTEAIALGHDLGHTPFGHAGERALNEICSEGFEHNVQSVRVVEKLEKKGCGLNLTWEVRDGILNHQTSGSPSTLEGAIVRIADKIAYINHDIDDAIRAGMLTEESLPKQFTEVLGHGNRQRLNTMIHDMIMNSYEKNAVSMSPAVDSAMKGLRGFMFEAVYLHPRAKEEELKAINMLKSMYEYYWKHFEELPEGYRLMHSEKEEKKERVICDYIAGMTDSYAIKQFQTLFIPKCWQV